MTNSLLRVSALLLAGGIGHRMKSTIPKQYLQLGSKAIARYSFDCLCMVPEIVEIVVVCEEEYRELFKEQPPPIALSFAKPGLRRQDSVYNGYRAIASTPDLICIHDAARPFVTSAIVKRVVSAAQEYGAATAAMPIKFTVKEANDEQLVRHTPDRSKIWEIQTPQALKPHIIERGFQHIDAHGLTVTDDVSLAEQLGLPVKLVEGGYTNLKVTTPEDLLMAEEFVKQFTLAQK